ncbi:radical SAM protein [Acidobacteriota bacterium]
MSEPGYYPRKVFVEKGSLKFPLTERILNALAHIPTETIQSPEEVITHFKEMRDPVGEGKKHLLITQQKGEFIKPCPCTPGYLGCNYFIINVDLNCPLDCSYCILQLYLSNPLITVHVNTDELWGQLDSFLSANPNRFLRIGTGELGDSLVLDHITQRSTELMDYFRSVPSALFELKTKTANIDNILSAPSAENIVVAWSLNAEKIADKEERGAPSIKERLAAAQVVSKRGFPVAFHFDPLILYPGWEDGYEEVIDALFTAINADRIAWISLGSLRFPHPLKEIIKKRSPDSRIVYEELIRGEDGKLRYFKPLRFQLYSTVVDKIQDRAGDRVPLYFCMESGEIWRKVLKKEIKGKETIEYYLSLPFKYRR